MAIRKTAADGRVYYQVESGDTLWDISKAAYGSGSKYMQLASINKLSNPNLISIGQDIFINPPTKPPIKPTVKVNKVTITGFDLQNGGDNTLYVSWTFDNKNNTDHYNVEWIYRNIIERTQKVETTDMYSTFSIPSGASYVKVRVIPVAKTKSENDTTPLFSGTWVNDFNGKECIYNVTTPPPVPNTPSIQINDELKLTATTDEYNETDLEIGTIIEFEILKNDITVAKTKSVKTTSVEDEFGVTRYIASIEQTVDAGGTYKVRCRAKDGENVRSEWSEYSNSIATIPANVSTPTCEVVTNQSIKLSWTAVDGAEKYRIQYTTDEKQFDAINGSVTTVDTNAEDGVTRVISGLTSGNTYHFRMKGVRGELESKDWSTIANATIGTGPAAPTTWSSTTTAIIGEDENVILYWVHNSEDESSQKYAEVELYIEGMSESEVNTISTDVSVEIGEIDSALTTVEPVEGSDGVYKIFYHVKNTEDEKDKDKTHSFIIDTANYNEGAKIRWRIRTAGITGEQGEEWSVERTIDIYNKPVLEVIVADTPDPLTWTMVTTLNSFPFYISANVKSYNAILQNPIGYHFSIVSNNSYESVDNVGNPVEITAGQEVYSKFFDNPQSSDSMTVTITPSDVDLENGCEYRVNCIVAMSSGVSISSEPQTFSVSWEDVEYEPNAEITVDKETCVAYIRPYCSGCSLSYHILEESNGSYTPTGDTYDDYIYGEPLDPPKYYNGNEVYTGMTQEGTDVYFCEISTITEYNTATMSIYRREFDGSFTEIATGVKNGIRTDPHPPLDYVRYRIVAIDDSTGAVSYHDTPSVHMGVKYIVIQWNERSSTFNADSGEVTADPSWSGSILRLPYNIDVSEKNASDISLIKYIGRKHPVSYYGTHLGTSATWNVVIPKDDVETLYTLRRLQAWMGDVYVREPSGTGYWATVSVSFNQKHKELTIPVTINVTRVDGGA